MKLSDYIAELEKIREAAGDVEVMAKNPSGGAGSFGFAVMAAKAPKLVKYGKHMGAGWAISDESAIPASINVGELEQIVLLG